MRTVHEILQAEQRYLGYWGRPTEVDFTINDLNRELIAALAKEHPTVLLGRFNSTKLTPYTGQVVYNFDFQFCVPVADDPRLSKLLQARNSSSDPLKCLDAIMNWIEALDGHLLAWA